MSTITPEETVEQLSQRLTRIEQKLDMLIMKTLPPHYDSTLRRTSEFAEDVKLSV